MVAEGAGRVTFVETEAGSRHGPWYESGMGLHCIAVFTAEFSIQHSKARLVELFNKSNNKSAQKK
jgi:hypothetical protein